MNILISGGAKNGKSFYAQKLAKQMSEDTNRPLYYIATMIPRDEEDHARIRRHLAERAGWGFETLERGTDLVGLLDSSDDCRQADDCKRETDREMATDPETETKNPVDPNGVFLLDSVTALLSNEMFRAESPDLQAAERVAADCTAFAKATGNTVFVSDYIYGDADRYDTMTEEYRRGLALVDRALAKVCDRVLEVSAGVIEEWK